MAKTAAEINNLKSQWLNDPCWDIETTEGFEDHTEELLAYRKEIELREATKEQERIFYKTRLLGLPFEYVPLVRYIEALEHRISYLDRIVSRMNEESD